MNIIILTTFDHPGGWEYLRSLKKRDIYIRAIIANINSQSVKKVRKIITGRVGNYYKLLELNDMYKYIDIPFYITDKINSPMTVKIIKDLKTDIVIFSADSIVKEEVINAPSIGILNCHPALLPEYRGCNAIEWPIYENKLIGSTCHLMDEGIDSGPIVYKEKMPIYREDKYEQIRARSLSFTAQVLAKGIKKLKNGLKPIPQKLENGKYYGRMDEKKLRIVRRILEEKKYSHYAN